jgi:tetratricopeptide (TPR) repeat protein
MTSLPTPYDRAQELRQQLQTKRVLFVLDGFERQLRAYSSLDAVYQRGDTTDTSRETRACVDQTAARLLKEIAAGATCAKLLLTTRLQVSDLEDRAGDALAGVLNLDLEKLPRDDAVAFMRAQGVKKGTDAEIANVCDAYGNHPLSLRLLSVLIKRDAHTPGDIVAAPRHDVYPELIQRQHHVLEQSYDVLPEGERALLSRIAAFRRPMTYAALAIFNDFGDEAKFDAALEDLRARGLLQRDTARNRYDLHPLVRRYAYERLTDKTAVHSLLRDYFAAMPVPDVNNVLSLEDLAPVIELFYHTVNAGLSHDAVRLYDARLSEPLYFRLGAYQTEIELLSAFFPNGEDQPSSLDDGKELSLVMNALATSYGVTGQPRRATSIHKRIIALNEQAGNVARSISELGNLGSEQIILGELEASEKNLKRAITLSRNVTNRFSEAITHQEFGLLLSYRGEFDEAEKELATGIELHSDTLGGQWWRGTSWMYRAQSALLRRDASQAIKSAREARRLKDIEFPGVGRVERDIIVTEWLLGAALLMEGEDLSVAATHLDEALMRCRRINLVESEPDILLSLARWQRAHGNAKEALTNAEQALAIADRCEFRLKQAEIHNFLARLAFEAGDRAAARQHAETAHERAWCDAPPHCYKPALDEAEKTLKKLGVDYRSN